MNRLLILGYHYIRDPKSVKYSGIHPLAPEDFLEHLARLKKVAPPLTPQEAEVYLDGTVELEKPASFLTFDDGLYKDHGEITVPLLEANGLRGAFFICSQPYIEKKALTVHKIHWLRAHMPPSEFADTLLDLLPAVYKQWPHHLELDLQQKIQNTYQFDTYEIAVLKFLINFVVPRGELDQATGIMLNAFGLDEKTFCNHFYMAEDTIKEIYHSGHLIGAHTHTHPALATLPADEAKKEVIKNLEWLEALIGKRPHWLSYPYGSDAAVPTDHKRFCQDCGIKYAISYMRGWNGSNVANTKLRKVDANEIDQFLS